MLPAPGKVTIDGDLKDWDFSGRIWVFADKDVRQRYSVEVAAMWDDSACTWRPSGKPHADVQHDRPGLQRRGRLEERLLADAHRTGPHVLDHDLVLHAKQIPVMHIAYWKSEADDRAGQAVKVSAPSQGGTDLGGGAEMAYRKDADGKGSCRKSASRGPSCTDRAEDRTRA